MPFYTPHSECEHAQGIAAMHEQVLFLEQVCSRYRFDASKKRNLMQSLEQVKQRLQDRATYVAVVGEFSAGKSTFINALLGDDLLKTSALVSTSVATQIRPGDKLQVDVGLKHESGGTQSVLRACGGSDERAIRACLQAATSDPEQAQHVAQVYVQHPASFLDNAVVLIDTPGISAEQEGHAVIARDVIEQVADVAIVIIPAPAAMSMTLCRFLKESLSPYLQRCLFVVTKMDLIPPHNQEKVLEYVQLRIEQELDLHQPPVFLLAPQLALDALEEEAPCSSDVSFWTAQFENMESELISRLHHDREHHIADGLTHRLGSIYDKLSKQLLQQKAEIEEKLATVLAEPSTPKDIDIDGYREHVLGMLTEDTSVAIDDYLRHLNQAQERASEDLKSLVYEAADPQAIVMAKPDGHCQVDTLLKQHLDQALGYLEGPRNQIYQIARQVEVEFGDEREGQIFSNQTQWPEFSITSCIGKINVGSGTKGSFNWWAFGLFFVFGLLDGDGIGLWVGLVLGLIFGFVFRSTHSDLKDQYWQALQPFVVDSFEQVRRQGQTYLTSYSAEVERAIAQVLQVHAELDKEELARRTANRKQQVARLRNQLTQVQNDLEAMDARKTACKEEEPLSQVA